MVVPLSENNFKNTIVKVLFFKCYYNWNIRTWAPIWYLRKRKREQGRAQDPRKPRKTLRLPIRERCIDASRDEKCASWPCHDWSGAAAALVRCIAQSPRTAVHGCSRVIMQVLPRPVTFSFNPRPQTDVECRLSPVLTPGALASGHDAYSSRLSRVSPFRTPGEPPNLLYHTECVISGMRQNEMQPPSRPVTRAYFAFSSHIR